FLVRGDAPGLARARQTTLDETRPQGRVQLRNVEARLLGESHRADGGAATLAALAATGRLAATVLAAEAVGAAGRALDRTVEH
ncbi:acyl-CoA dehydrogenase, partial [Streptomyces sp. RSD-27]